MISRLEIGAVRAANFDAGSADLPVLKAIAGADRSRRRDHILFEFIKDTLDYCAPPQELIAFLRDTGYVHRDVEGRPYVGANELRKYDLWASKAELVG